MASGFPRTGDLVVKSGDHVTIQWQANDIGAFNTYFMKGNVKIPLAEGIRETNYTFVVDNTHFSPEYLECKVRIEARDSSSVFGESSVFKVVE